jgi:hypothetical protein
VDCFVRCDLLLLRRAKTTLCLLLVSGLSLSQDRVFCFMPVSGLSLSLDQVGSVSHLAYKILNSQLLVVDYCLRLFDPITHLVD